MIYSRRVFFKGLLACVFVFVFGLGYSQTPIANSKNDTLHLFLIGNSFSQNATRYLPQLAKEGGHPLVIGRAEIGGCPLKTHWELAELAEANPEDPKGKPYGGKSLRMLLSKGVWDVVTLQQYSMHSGNPGTYNPYARKLYDFIKKIQPNAKVVMHQTWAYRSDAEKFCQISDKEFAKSQKEMWEKSRAAYHATAKDLGIEIIPVGDAFWKVSTSSKWMYHKDTKFDYANPVAPALPNQLNSINNGYSWDKDKKLVFDPNHANNAGCYLGGLVWYTFLFKESPEHLKFVPEKVSEDFAEYLKKVAKSVVK